MSSNSICFKIADETLECDDSFGVSFETDCERVFSVEEFEGELEEDVLAPELVRCECPSYANFP